MKKGTRGEARVHIEVPPEKLYEIVSDVTRMGEWSPETIRCQWLGDANGPAVGVRFKGTNRRGIARWSTKPQVVTADPAKEFAFETSDTLWSYSFEATAGGTELTEAFEMTKDEPVLLALLGRYVLRIKDRKADLERGMQQTLERIKTVAERDS
ncbi:MAG: SRPBCC family protein [Actinobacteria bacterium]|nr:SRPBCC family protein [Actinomycetota bacterium]